MWMRRRGFENRRIARIDRASIAFSCSRSPACGACGYPAHRSSTRCLGATRVNLTRYRRSMAAEKVEVTSQPPRRTSPQADWSVAAGGGRAAWSFPRWRFAHDPAQVVDLCRWRLRCHARFVRRCRSGRRAASPLRWMNCRSRRECRACSKNPSTCLPSPKARMANATPWRRWCGQGRTTRRATAGRRALADAAPTSSMRDAKQVADSRHDARHGVCVRSGGSLVDEPLLHRDPPREYRRQFVRHARPVAHQRAQAGL